MKNVVHTTLATLVFAALALSAHAVQITGTISLVGNVVPAGNDVNTATSFTTLGPALANQTSGSFLTATSGINTILQAGADSTFAMTPFAFGTSAAPALAPSPVQVWTTTNAGITTSFLLTSITLVDHNIPDQVTLMGMGVFSMTGFDNTTGTFNFTAQQAGATEVRTFSFSSSQATVVPDSGSTGVLLGLGLGFLGFGMRKLRANKA